MRMSVIRLFNAGVVLVALALPTQAATISASYVDSGGETWDATRKGVIGQAIQDWQSVIGNNETISVTFDFTHAGTGNYLGVWEGNYLLFEGTDIYPWTPGVNHTIHFNADRFSGTNYTWWDPTPATGGDQPFEAWDALSVARHEIGHMFGFTAGFYFDNFATGTQFDKWTSHISGTTFDQGGLNVTMAADLTHVADSGTTAGDLMVTLLPNSVRRGISITDLNMLQLAYNYTIVPEPSSVVMLLGTALVGLLALARRRRKRAA